MSEYVGRGSPATREPICRSRRRLEGRATTDGRWTCTAIAVAANEDHAEHPRYHAGLPALGQASTPGQFLHLRWADGWDPLLRRPMSIFRIRPDGVSLMVRDVGGARSSSQTPVWIEHLTAWAAWPGL